MKVEVIAKVDDVLAEDIRNKTVIVLDVLRATSTIVTALANGAKEVIPVETIGQAGQYRKDGFILAGERFCKRVPGFPLTNSPTEMSSYPIEGKSVVLTTTNGTRAIQKSNKAGKVIIGSLLNGPAAARLAMELRKDTTILCSGSRQEFALEDGLAAGYIVSEMVKVLPDLTLDDLSMCMLANYHHFSSQLTQIISSTATGRRLVSAGAMDDITFCSQTNIFSFAPVLNEQSITVDFAL